MGENSVSKDEDEIRIPPEAVKPFWVEVGVFGLAGLASLLIWVALLRLPFGDANPMGWIPLVMAPLVPAFVLPPVLRAILRPVLRRQARLDKDPLPWWFKVFGVFWTPDRVRKLSPAWHIEDDRLHLPVIGHGTGVWLGGLIIVVALALIEPETGFWLSLLAPPLTLFTLPFALIFLIGAALNVYRYGRLPRPGSTSLRSFFGWSYD